MRIKISGEQNIFDLENFIAEVNKLFGKELLCFVVSMENGERFYFVEISDKITTSK